MVVSIEPHQRSYYHWLDGSYVLREWDARPNARLAEAESLLKLRLLLGDLVTLSDVQLVDSPVVNSAFANPDFVRLARARPDLVRLVAAPGPEAGRDVEHQSVAVSGLARSLADGWVSCEADRTDDVRRLADAILKDRVEKDWPEDGGPALLGFLASQAPSARRDRLIGIANGVAHFFHGPPTAARRASVAPTTFYKVLLAARETPGIPDEAEAIITDTIEWVTRNAPDERRLHQRSFFQERLAAGGFGGRPWPADHEARWQTLHSAWNASVANTVGARRGGVRRRSDGVTVSFVTDRAADIVLPADGGRAIPPGLGATRGAAARITWDARRLTWGEVGKVLGDAKVEGAQRAYRDALAVSPEAADDAARQMTHDVGSAIRKTAPLAVNVALASGAAFLGAVVGERMGPQGFALIAGLCLPARSASGRVADYVAASALRAALTEDD